MKTKKSIKTIICLVIMSLLVFTLAACADDNSNVQVTIYCDDSLETHVGETGQFRASVNSDCPDRTITMSSKNTSILTIDNNGHYTAVGYGETEITITAYNNTTKDVKVYVRKYADDIEYTFSESDSTIIKLESANNEYAIVTRTDTNGGKVKDVDFKPTVVPVEATKDINFVVTPEREEDKDILSVEGGHLIIKNVKDNAAVPRKDGSVDAIKFTVNMKADNVNKDIIIWVCPIAPESIAVNIKDNINGQRFYEDSNTLVTSYANVKFKLNHPVKKEFNIGYKKVSYNCSFKTSLTLKNQIKIDATLNSLEYYFTVLIGGKVEAGVPQDVTLTVSEDNIKLTNIYKFKLNYNQA